MTLRARLSRYQLQFGGTVRTARGAWQHRSGTVLTLADEHGVFGQGEAAPLPGYSDDTLADAERQLGELELDVLESALSRAVAAPESLSRALRRYSSLTPSARFALETAAIDWLARRRGEPVHLLLAGIFRMPRAPGAPLQLCALLDSDEPVESAERAVAAGFRSLKLKVGLVGREREERALVESLQARFGKQVRLRLDANCAWSSAEARERLAAFALPGIEFIEEPTAAGQPPLIAPPLAVALDESLRREPFPSRAELRARGVLALVLKPTVLGGLLRTLAFARRASAARCAIVVSHCFEGPVAYAALCELALALRPSETAQGLGRHVGLSGWSAFPSACLNASELARHNQHGLGLGAEPLEPPMPHEL